jgi:hypothetical protein
MKPVVRYLALAVVLAAGVFTSVALAGKPPSPPGQTSNPGSPGDDCSHGNSDKPCKPDPQPGHGSECDDHGNASGNEDHCAATTTAVPNVSSSTSTISSSTTSNITTNGGSGTTTQATPAGSTTTTISVGVAGTTTTDATATSAVEGTSTGLLPPKTGTPPGSDAQPQSAAAERLPFTGFPTWLVALAGGLMLATGIALRRKGTP